LKYESDEKFKSDTEIAGLSQKLETLQEKNKILVDNLLAKEQVVEMLSFELQYQKGQVEIYQARLGLLPQKQQAEIPKTEQRPLRQPRVPFSVAAAKIQADRTEEYWRQRAATVDSGTTGSTSETTPTVSEKES
jgi:hypothetical protein